MKNRVLSLVIIGMFVLSAFFSVCIFEDENVLASTYYVGGTGGGNFSSIQSAINKAGSGDTVYVYNGTYIENVVINKSIKLIGEGAENTTIDGNGSGDVITVSASYVVISGFTVMGSGTQWLDAGIELNYIKNCSIMNNNITSNGNDGLLLRTTSNNRIENNTLYSNNATGMFLSYHSNNNYISNNIIENNGNGYTNHSEHQCGVIVYYSNHNHFIHNELINNSNYGFQIYYSNDNIVNFNKIINHKYGAECYTKYGRNIVFLNDFIGNNHSMSRETGHCLLNSTQPLSYLYNNTNYTSYMGNYWDDYNGTDPDGNGIGNTPYKIGLQDSVTDPFPLMKPFKNYHLIPSKIEAELNETCSNSTNLTVSLSIKTAKLNAKVSGILNGTVNVTEMELVMINSSYFAGMGFFTSVWRAEIEGHIYEGHWQGMFFNKSAEGKIYLKGTVSGGLQGITDGYLTELKNGSGIYDIYNSSWTIRKLGANLVFAEFMVNGSIHYKTSKNDSSDIYVLQSYFSGKAEGYYNKSLGVVLVHIRINNKTNEYYGKGFSIMTYVCTWGSGEGWSYDKLIEPNVVKLTGFFTQPLWGILFGELDENGPNRTLSITILRIDIGLPPRPILKIRVWGPWRASPGQTIHYFLECRNIGLKAAYNTELVMVLPNNATYKSNTGSGSYNSTSHAVTWRQNISAKSKILVSTKLKVKWGLSWGTKLKCIGYVQDYIKNVTLASDSFITRITPARDPNAKYGPEGNVTPGQKLNYKIEFENEGAGIAYGVYFIDTLSNHLNDSSLNIGAVISTSDSSVIAPPGIYNPNTRTITWFVGEVGPGSGGYANISINVKESAAHGDEILNYGIIYFPSVPEITLTNGIVSIVKINQIPTAKAGENREVYTLEDIFFDGSGSFDPDGILVNYTWDFGDGEKGYGKVTSHSYEDDGVYYVRLTVMDNDLVTGFHEISVNVLNRLPEAEIEVDLFEVKTNEEVTFDATKSTDLDGTVSEYYFDFGDGSNSGWLQSPTVSHPYSDGTKIYTAQLSVKDDDGDISTNSAEIEIKVNNRNPIPKLNINPVEAFTHEDISFNAELSTDPDGIIKSYYFDFGDNTNSGWVTTPMVLHQYTQGEHMYRTELIVKDDDGETGSTNILIYIKNHAPYAEAGSDQVVDTNQEVHFDGKLSSDIDGTIVSYEWTFGDGSSGTGKQTTHKYADDGQYNVTLTVTDIDSAIGKDTCIITVNNVKPIAGFTVSQTNGDLTTVFEFRSTSYDTDGTIAKYIWDFGDGEISEQDSPTHQYRHTGAYTVTLIVQDDDGIDSVAFKTDITVSSNLLPVAIAESSVNTAKINEIITFGASSSYDPDGKIINFTWQFGDGIIGYGQSVSHSYKELGTYTVTLTIYDEFNSVAKTTLDIVIVEDLVDSDGDGFTDDIDAFPTDSAAAVDTDGDDYPDYWNPGKSEDDSTTGLTIDAYPNDPSKHEKEATADKSGGLEIPIYVLIIIIILFVIIAIIPIFIKKNRRNLVGEPYTDDKVLGEVSNEVLTDSDGQSMKISCDEIKNKLDKSHKKGEISEETYKYINEEILFVEDDLENKAD